MVHEPLSWEYLGISLPHCPARPQRSGGCCSVYFGSERKCWEKPWESRAGVHDAHRGGSGGWGGSARQHAVFEKN